MEIWDIESNSALTDMMLKELLLSLQYKSPSLFRLTVERRAVEVQPEAKRLVTVYVLRAKLRYLQ